LHFLDDGPNEYQPKNSGQGGGIPADDPDDIYFDHDFQPLGGPTRVDRVKPRTFFEDFRG
jgi:hypothetical protein